ncbi:MAG: leishmanolysin-related zinc metalloendopeptidase [Gemmatimonadales bacterium]
MTPRRAVLVSGLVAIASVGCGGEKPTGASRQVTLSIVRGGGQSGEVAAQLGSAVTLRLRDGEGPIGGVAVAMTAATGSGTVTPATVITDAIGEVSFTWQLGNTAGPQSAVASAPGTPSITVSATGLAGPPAGMETASAPLQYAVAGRPVPVAPAVRVVDRFGNGIEGATVEFVLQEGVGTITGASTQTDGTGVGRIGGWTLGRKAGNQFLVAAAFGRIVNFIGYATPAGLVPLGPTQQVANVGTEVPIAPIVRAVDGDGLPLALVEVSFEVKAGGGRVTRGAGLSGLDGVIRVGSWVLGTTAALNELEVTSPGLPAPTKFSAVASDPPPAVMTAFTSTNVAGFAGNFVAAPSVRVVDAAGRPVAGRQISFRVVSGGGTIHRADAPLDASGIGALGGWRLGLSGGVQEVQAELGGVAPVTFAVTTTPPPAGGFRIELRYRGGRPTPSQDSIFQAAATRWSALIIGDQPDVPIDFAEDPDGCYPALRETVDDLVIFAEVVQIDGPGGILGAAGPCLVRDENLLPVVGAMIFDRDDVDRLQFDSTLAAVFLHEMAHVMGFTASLWRLKGLLSEEDPANPVFLGATARGSWAAIAAPTASLQVPLENTGGPGTRLSHWRESVLDNELMTGFADRINPLSALTVAALRDLGYFTNDLPADPFALPTPAATLSSISGSRLHSVPWPAPIRTVDRWGRVARVFR